MIEALIKKGCIDYLRDTRTSANTGSAGPVVARKSVFLYQLEDMQPGLQRNLAAAVDFSKDSERLLSVMRQQKADATLKHKTSQSQLKEAKFQLRKAESDLRDWKRRIRVPGQVSPLILHLRYSNEFARLWKN